MVVVGIVGGVASGKSTVAGQLELLGAQRIPADQLGHDVLKEEAVKSEMAARWGSQILNGKGEVERATVAQIVFAGPPHGPPELAFLERLTHPRIGVLIQRRLEQLARDGTIPAAVLDAAVMLKAGWNEFCDQILFVEVARPVRLARAVSRGWSEDDFATREAAQESLDHKRVCADWVIDNGDSPEHTFAQVRAFWRSLGLNSPLLGTD